MEEEELLRSSLTSLEDKIIRALAASFLGPSDFMTFIRIEATSASACALVWEDTLAFRIRRYFSLRLRRYLVPRS